MAGQPLKEIDMAEVKRLLAFKFHLDEIAAVLDINRSTLYMRLKDSGIEKYSDISDGDLDYTDGRFKKEHPNDGEFLKQAHLLRVGIHVQRRRLRLSIRRVDPVNIL